MKYSVHTFRSAGLEARWSRTRKGAPCILVRNPNSDKLHQRRDWWLVSDHMWKRAQEVGVVRAFDECTLLGNFFSVPA